jgi:hypothetical protein
MAEFVEGENLSGRPSLYHDDFPDQVRRLGGLSTGPRTAEGKARIAAAQRRRWAERRSSIQIRTD